MRLHSLILASEAKESGGLVDLTGAFVSHYTLPIDREPWAVDLSGVFAIEVDPGEEGQTFDFGLGIEPPDGDYVQLATATVTNEPVDADEWVVGQPRYLLTPFRVLFRVLDVGPHALVVRYVDVEFARARFGVRAR